jgi:nifR3 family TIM-barrel protein
MTQGFWKNLKRPIYALAPMADVTDAAFRRLIAKYGKPDITWTEFVSIDGLMSEEGRKKLLAGFWYTEAERPIVAQIFGSKPDNFYEVAKLIVKLGFDGIDINMGCPDRSVEKQGAGAALIKNFDLARDIIKATKEGAGDLPVSVKTRIGYNKNIIGEWLPNLARTEPAAITIHGRTRKEMSLVPAHWDVIAEGAKIIKNINPEIVVLGNGDAQDLNDADQKICDWGVDGVMIGRGIFGNPWLFNRKVDHNLMPLNEKFKVMLEHTWLFEELFAGRKNFDIMKKHYKAYVTGFDGAKELRTKLFETKSAREVQDIIQEYLQKQALPTLSKG